MLIILLFLHILGCLFSHFILVGNNANWMLAMKKTTCCPTSLFEMRGKGFLVNLNIIVSSLLKKIVEVPYSKYVPLVVTFDLEPFSVRVFYYSIIIITCHCHCHCYFFFFTVFIPSIPIGTRFLPKLGEIFRL